MESSVTSLTLKIRAPESEREGLAAMAEEFAAGVLNRCDELLEARAPGRVLLVRRFDLSLRLRRSGLGDTNDLEACAEAVAQDLDERARRGDPDVAVYADESDWRAAHLEAWADDRTDWRFDRLAATGEPRRLVSSGARTELVAVLTMLARRGSLRSVLERMPAAQIAQMAETLGVASRGSRGVDTDSIADASGLDISFTLVDRIASAIAKGNAGRPGDKHSIDSAFDELTRADDSRPAGVPSTDAAQTIDAVDSAFGGVFYLCRLALELSAGEILWRACLPEGVVFERAAAALCGAAGDGDPALARFGGGAASQQPIPEIGTEQQAEVALALLGSAVDALACRQSAAWPRVVLQLADVHGERMLIASAAGSGFVLLALPAGSRTALESALTSFLDAWPASALPVRAAPALATLDRRARIQPVTSPAGTDPLLIVREGREGSPWWTAVVSQVAGTLGQLVAARLGSSSSSSRDRVTRSLAIPARIVSAADRLDIRIPMDCIDLDVRRAGLDVDPGWVPWLRRHVTFTFEESQDPGEL
jgi:hypothetical protein